MEMIGLFTYAVVACQYAIHTVSWGFSDNAMKIRHCFWAAENLIRPAPTGHGRAAGIRWIPAAD